MDSPYRPTPTTDDNAPYIGEVEIGLFNGESITLRLTSETTATHGGNRWRKVPDTCPDFWEMIGDEKCP